jgi:hypothetical protein
LLSDTAPGPIAHASDELLRCILHGTDPGIAALAPMVHRSRNSHGRNLTKLDQMFGWVPQWFGGLALVAGAIAAAVLLHHIRSWQRGVRSDKKRQS